MTKCRLVTYSRYGVVGVFIAILFSAVVFLMRSAGTETLLANSMLGVTPDEVLVVLMARDLRCLLQENKKKQFHFSAKIKQNRQKLTQIKMDPPAAERPLHVCRRPLQSNAK